MQYEAFTIVLHGYPFAKTLILEKWNKSSFGILYIVIFTAI